KEIKSFIQDNNLENFVFLTGYKLNPYPYIAKSDLYICPSLAESFGISVAEALTLKTPILSVRNDGVEEILKYGKYGELCDNDIDSLYAALKNIICFPEYYDKIRKRAYKYKNEYSIKNALQKINEVIN